jgi:hypothetical protein
MADEGLKDFITTWILGGLLVFCLLTFTIHFIANNNSDALNDGTEDIFNSASDNLSSRLIASSTDSNEILNITSNTNPEVSDLGSRDSVAVGFESSGTAKSYWEASKILFSWVFPGTVGKILMILIGSLIGFTTVFLIWRFIKIGT